MESYQPIIGLEVHVELKTKSKMFCSCSADYFGHEPNTHVCPICLGLPGSLPVPSKKAIEWTVIVGLSLNCQVASFSKFDRKNYFYPDLPKGFQISQYDLPLARDGKLKIENARLLASRRSGPTRQGKLIRIRRVHLEEDTAKMVHTTLEGKKVTLIDFNRSGVPLLEIVTEPDLNSAEGTKFFLQKLQQILRYLGVSDCDMEKGSMRLEANISLKEVKKKKLPDYKVEIKNLNSFRFVEKAINYEIKRQLQLIKVGKRPIQETRGWNEIKQVTYSQRWKEAAQDYRYFPEPDLPPIRWSKSQISNLKSQISKIKLPAQKIKRFIERYGIDEYGATILAETQQRAVYFEEAVKVGKKHKINPKEIANVIINKRLDTEKILPVQLVKILVKRKVVPRISKKELVLIVSKIIKENQKAVADFKKGKIQALEFLVGQVARKTKDRADPNLTRKLLLEKLQ